jgi:hypothetical protein
MLSTDISDMPAGRHELPVPWYVKLAGAVTVAAIVLPVAVAFDAVERLVASRRRAR